MTAPLALFILSGVLATSFISGILGMAGGMILMGLLAWVLPVQQAMTLHATAQFFANGSRAFIHRRHLHKQSIKYYLIGLAGSFSFFCAVAFVPDKAVVFALLGIAPFLPQLFLNKIRFDFTRPPQAVLCGIIVTCFHLTAGVSGPLLDMFFQKIDMTRHQVVATKAFTQSVSHVLKFIYFAVIVPQALNQGRDLPPWIYLAVIPVAIFGTHSAKHVLNRLTDHQFYKATQIVLWMIGVVYIVKAALLLKGSP